MAIFGNLVYFPRFGTLCEEKSGKPAPELRRSDENVGRGQKQKNPAPRTYLRPGVDAVKRSLNDL
jgi:hypothetical protein